MTNDGSTTSSAAQNHVTAIDILLELDATIIQRAQAANERPLAPAKLS